jgi:hypothetical protein
LITVNANGRLLESHNVQNTMWLVMEILSNPAFTIMPLAM